MWASGERPMPYPTLELQIKSFLPRPAWRSLLEKGDTVPQHPSSGAEMIRVHSSPWGYLYCAHGQL